MAHTCSITASLNINNLLIKIGNQVKSEWYKFGLAIGITRDFLDQLSGEDKQCLIQVLEYWLKNHQGKPTWEEVTKAKQKIKLKPELTSNEGIAIIIGDT